MTLLKRGFYLILCLALLAVTLTPAVAQDGSGRNLIRTPLERPVIRQLRHWLLNRSEPDTTPPPIAFKVPAGEVTRVICRLDRLGIVCAQTIEPGMCPREIEVVMEGGARATVPVNCTGPDADGSCECDFVQ